MQKRNILSGAVILLVLAGAALAADITGAWSGTMSMGDNSFTLTYSFKQDGDKLSGTVTAPQGDPLPLVEGKVDGDKVSFAVKVDMNGNATKFVSSGTIKGDEIAITTKAEGVDFPPNSMTLKRTK
jgi:opacity protein-like surface antigen